MKNNLFRFLFLILIILSVFFFTSFTYARAESGVPSIISYQGRLTDLNGNLLGGSGTPYYFKFSFWDSSVVGQGNRIWPTSVPNTYSINVKQGVFNVNIGDTDNGYPDALNYDFNSNKNIYLQVDASANNSVFETLSPRQQISATAFAEIASTSNYSNLSGTSTYSYNSGNAVTASTSNYSASTGTSTYSYFANNSNTASTSDYATNAGTSTYSTSSSHANSAGAASTSDYSTNSGLLQGLLASQFIRSDVANLANLTISGNGNFTGDILGANITATGTLSGNSIIASSTSAGALTANTASIGNLSGLLFGTNGSVGSISTSSLAINTDNLVQGGTNLFYNNSLVKSFLDTLNKGYFFSTTSTDYWKSQNNFFSTSSADVWDATMNRWATSTSDVWLTLKTTDNLAQGQVNKYYSSSLLANDLAGTTTDALAQGLLNKYFTSSLFASTLAGTTTDALAQGLTNKYYSTNLFASSLAGTTTDALAQGSLNKYFTSSLFASTLAGTTTDALSQGILNKYFTTALFASTLAGTTTDALAQGLNNKYFTPGLLASTLSGTTTDALAQGSTNKYYSNSLFASSLAGTTTTALPEGNNLYFTASRASTTAISVLGATTSLPNITTLAGLSLSSSQVTGLGSLATSSTINNSNWSGTALAVGNGGTDQTSYTDGQLLIGNSSGNTLTKATLTGTSNEITVTNGNGSITLSTPQAINSTATPAFASTTLSNFTTGSIPFFTSGGSLNQNNTNLFWDNMNNRLGIGTSSLSNTLEVNGNGYFAGNLTSSTFTATSTTATSTFNGALQVGNTGATGDAGMQFGPDSNAWTIGYKSSDSSFRISSSTALGTNDIFTLNKAGNFTLSSVGATSTINGNLYVNGVLRSTTSYNGDIIFANGFRITEASTTASTTPGGANGLYINNQKDSSVLSIDENGDLTVAGDICGNGTECYGQSLNSINNQIIALNSSAGLASSTALSILSSQNTTQLSLSQLSSAMAVANQNIYGLSTSLAALSSTTSNIQLDLASTTIALFALASSTATISSNTETQLATSTSFIQTIATAIQNLIQSTGNWVVDKFTAKQADITQINSQMICLGSTCIDEAALKKIMLANSINLISSSSPANTTIFVTATVTSSTTPTTSIATSTETSTTTPMILTTPTASSTVYTTIVPTSTQTITSAPIDVTATTSPPAPVLTATSDSSTPTSDPSISAPTTPSDMTTP